MVSNGKPPTPTSALSETDRERIWRAVSADWDAQIARRRKARVALLSGGGGLGLAAALIVGILIGRFSDTPSDAVDARRAPAAVATELSMPYRVVVGEHFRETETLLARFAATPDGDREVARLAGELLATTRLLKGSRAGDEPELQQLLQDVELLLAQLSMLVDPSDTTEREVVREGLEESTVLPRLRQVVQDRNVSIGI